MLIMYNLQNLETKESRTAQKNLTLNGQAKKKQTNKGKQKQKCNFKPYKKNTNKAGKLRYL